MGQLPGGTLTLFFSNVENSMGLLDAVGPDRHADLLAAHREIVRDAAAVRGGVEVDAHDEAFFCVFERALQAAAAAVDVQRRYAGEAWPEGVQVRVRIGLHTGEPRLAGDHYVGMALHRGARIMTAAHGGQILVSEPTADVLRDQAPDDLGLEDLGEHVLKGLTRPQRLVQLVAEGLPSRFPPPRAASSAAETGAPAEFRILGPLEIVRGSVAVPLAGTRQRALLALLLLNANETVSVERIIDELWGEEPPETGAKAVQVRVSQLRRALAAGGLEEPVIVTQGGGYVAEVGPGQLDALRFERLVEAGEQALADGHAVRAAELLREALALWRGAPLAEFRDAPFARTAASRLEELNLTALARRIDADLERGMSEAVIAELEELVGRYPYREGLRRRLMLALYRAGRQADALGVYHAARHALLDGLGLEPGRELHQLEQSILRQDPALEVARPPGGAGARAVRNLLPERSILVVPGDLERLDELLRIAEPLTRRPPREIVVTALVADDQELRAATLELQAVRERLEPRGLPVRTVAFTSGRRAEDTVRLAADETADLLLVDAPVALLSEGRPPEDLEEVWRTARCDVAVLVPARGTGSGDAEIADRPIVVPFGGGPHEWAALELGAWTAAARGSPLRLLGSATRPAAGRRDASRLLARVSLILQRVIGITAEPVLVPPGHDSVLKAVGDASLLCVGLSDRWPEEGLGAARLSLATGATVPTLLVRRGASAPSLAPAQALTRYTWSSADIR